MPSVFIWLRPKRSLTFCNFCISCQKPKDPRSKINWTLSGTGPCLDCGQLFFTEQGFGSVHCPAVQSLVQATLVGDASATDITEEAALARNAGSEPQLALSVLIGHSDDDWTQTHEPIAMIKIQTNNCLFFTWFGLFYFFLVLHDKNAVLNKKRFWWMPPRGRSGQIVSLRLWTASSNEWNHKLRVVKWQLKRLNCKRLKEWWFKRQVGNVPTSWTLFKGKQ